jgi:hypothetical protein
MATTVAAPRRLVGPEIGGRALGILVGVAVGGICAALTLAVHGQSPLRTLAMLIVVAGTIWFATTRRVAIALALWMLYIGLLDAPLKLTSGSNLVTFVRDVLLYAICAGVLIRAVVEARSLRFPPLSGWVFAFVGLVLIQLANPADGTLWHSVAGIRQEVEFIPLFFLTAAFVRTKRALWWFVVLLLFIGVANGIASWIQYHETPQQLAAWGPGYAQRVLGTGGFQFSGRTFYTASGEFTRPFGLGTDAGEGGVMGAFALAAALALLIGFRGAWWKRALVVLCLAGSVIAVYTSQGRAAVIASAICVFAFVILGFTIRGRRIGAMVGCIGVALALLLIQQFISVNSSSDTRYTGLTASSLLSTTEHARGVAFAAIPDNVRHYPFGAGLGSVGPAAGVSGAPSDAYGLNGESEISFLVLETGIPGAVVLIGFTVALAILCVRRIQDEPDRQTRLLLAAVTAPVAGMLALYAVSPLTPSTPVGPYLWGIAGVVSYWCVVRPRERAAARASTSDSYA